MRAVAIRVFLEHLANDSLPSPSDINADLLGFCPSEDFGVRYVVLHNSSEAVHLEHVDLPFIVHCYLPSFTSPTRMRWNYWKN